MHDILLITAAVLVTMSTRFIPFLIFGEKRKTPAIIEYLGTVLPCAIMGMLVVYCLKDISFLASPFGIPEIISCIVVAALHIWKRNSLLSIGGGTVCYMLLVQLVF
ncbi:MAG: branched-chain amino acid transporter permease [Oscillospiraceae bacterium]|nr:branched-chain amino acid transporter permease [Oscillospiraceae bacterium]